MTLGGLARALYRLLALVVLAGSGAYLLVYLYRWEWNRAVVAGIFFVAAEVVLVAETILARLHRLERRLDEQASHVVARPDRADGRASGTSPFAWLDQSDGFGVFIPVLMGVGVVLSAIAYLVERLAAHTGPSAGGEGVARKLAPLELPRLPLAGAFPFTAPAPSAWAIATSGRSLARAGSAAKAIVALAITALAVTATVNALAEWTANRPDPGARGGASMFELRLLMKGEDRAAHGVAEALWISCRNRLPDEARAQAFTDLGDDGASFVVTPALGRNALRRFQGCLQDATLDLVQATVLDVSNIPEEGPPFAPAQG